MKVVFLAARDYANVGWSYIQALKSVGVDAQGFKIASHPFGYLDEMNVITPGKHPEVQKLVDSADIIQIIYSSLGKMDININLKKNIVIHHGGSAYRKRFASLNVFWNCKSAAAIIETPDLLHLGARNEHYITSPVDTSMLTPKFYDGNRPLRIAHYSSSPFVKTKGTDVIMNILNNLKKEFDFEIYTSDKLVSWRDNIDRVSECDIYIDQLSAVGEYGVSTKEAAALGKIVVSTHMGVAEYNKVFGDTKVIVSNTPEKMRENLIWFLNQSPKDIRRIQEETRNWIVAKHSYVPIGHKLKNIYNGVLKGERGGR